MAKIEVPFAMHEGKAGFTQNSAETLVNMHADIVQSGRAKIVRHQRPGLALVTANTLEKRCVEVFRSTTYMVLGDGFYSYDGTTLTLLGTLNSSAGRCTMIFNDNAEVMISDGQRAYAWDGTTFSTVTLPSLVRCGVLAYLGGYGIFNATNTGKFYITAVNDFTSVDELDFATAESSPDNLISVYVDHNELWLGGTHSTEVWQLTGGSDFPFTPLTNAVLERGCGAKLSYNAEDNTIYFLGDDRVVYRADGYRPARVSTSPVEDAIGRVSVTAKDAAYSMVYTVRGHKFYTLTFPGELTVQYNIGTGLWNRASTYGFPAWNVIGSLNTPADFFLTPTAICSLDPELATDEGGIMRRGGISAPGWNNGEDISVHAIRLDVEVGRAPAGVSANVMMRFAPDGETFGNERWKSLGGTGDFRRHVTWRNLGRGEKPTAEFWITDPVPFQVNNILARVS